MVRFRERELFVLLTGNEETGELSYNLQFNPVVSSFHVQHLIKRSYLVALNDNLTNTENTATEHKCSILTDFYRNTMEKKLYRNNIKISKCWFVDFPPLFSRQLKVCCYLSLTETSKLNLSIFSMTAGGQQTGPAGSVTSWNVFLFWILSRCFLFTDVQHSIANEHN